MNEAFKIDEADFFLAHLAKAADPKATRYFASAFLSAARSGLQYARLEAAGDKERGLEGKPGGQQWYDTWVGADPVVKFLKDHRDINIHARPLPMQTNITIQLRGVEARMNRTAVTRPTVPEETPQARYDYQFESWTGPEDVLALSARYLDAITKIIADGREKGFLTV